VAALGLQPAFGMVFAWGALVPLVRAQEHWPPVLLGAVFSATPCGYGIGTALGGRLADRLPPRRLCWAGLGLLGAGFAVAFAAPSALTFVVFYAFVALGLGGGIALTGSVAALASFVPGRTGMAGGAASATYAASAVVLAPLIGALAPHLGWIGALRVVGVSVALGGSALLALMPGLPARHLARAEAAADSRSLLRRPGLWRGFALALCGSVFGTFAAVGVGAEAAATGGPGWLPTAAVALLALGNASGRLAGGVAADRAGVRWVLAAVYVTELAASVALFSRAGAVVLMAAALAAGAALGANAGCLARVGAETAPGAPNTAFGLVFTGYTAGAVIGPIAGAAVGSPQAWLVTAAPALAGLALLGGRRRVSARAGGPDSGSGT
jgi:OFA family oxalate/formate antiporter-like MFS transporter